MPHLSLLSTPVDEILESLKQSKFRSSFHLSQKLRAYATDLGEEKVREHANDLLSKRLFPSVQPNDGKQTPMKGHPVFIAQHACALCCRGCLQKWYGIEPDRDMTPEERLRAIELATAWINEDLKREVPTVKRKPAAKKTAEKKPVDDRQGSFDF